MADTEESPERDPIDVLADEYAQRRRRGENPSIEEYAHRYPELADEIRRLFPAVAFLERGKFAATSSGVGLGGSELTARNALAIHQLGENRIVRELGRGGMGIVYEAIQESLGRRVAVKVLPRHAQGDDLSRQRFLREARAVARLQHAHIVPIYAVGEQDGLLYYVMALINGQGMDRVMTDSPEKIPAEPAERAQWVARLGRQAALALAYAHAQSVLHRDIKPANLLLDASGGLWLADFGLAKLSDDLTLTATGELPGTLRYLAPECLHGKADVRSDIYSLGLTLYEMLVGRPAFDATDRVHLLHQIGTRHVPAPRLVLPELPREIETIILKATARDPAARYQTAGALADDLGHFVDGRPIVARRATAASRLVHWGLGNPAAAVFGGVSVLLLGVLTAVLVWFFALRPPPPFGEPPFPPPPPPRHGEFGPGPPRKGWFWRPPPPPPPPPRRHSPPPY